MGERSELTTRERILAAAAGIIGEDGVTARLSVRAVAARAEVSTGSLRHHFPTQQVLRDEVMSRVYDWMLPDISIDDTAVPPRDRLVHCLRQVLDMSGTGSEARHSMVLLMENFVTVEQTEAMREAYLAMQRDGQRRMEGWLGTLAEEVGTLPVADIPRRARHLGTVLNGLALERALPAEDSLAQRESEALYAAADMALAPQWMPGVDGVTGSDTK
ncbi:TetR/AcrR family transcriptional regulator [Brachybacterium sacelli]|uniref:AcrR family transcriptional regulator n=1 Tax=Brachybacterium sacelli TaxID=173364 RepID=A0ABS4X302_9MICO|nr:TetR/AcrR family transcriptional regulator [Brachybacterium sacelli]MBP2382849.1 AcrR family transcriptional regulator [Brachybacterium sacelli]